MNQENVNKPSSGKSTSGDSVSDILQNINTRDVMNAANRSLESLQQWVNEHKILTTLIGAAALYFMGGKRLQKITGFAIKSGIAAALANKALGIDASDVAKNKSAYH